jgi:predicted nuclease with TOPRIM domain
MKETEEKLIELQGQHHALIESYETLQLEYSAVKEELERLQSQHSPIRINFLSCLKEWDEFEDDSVDPLMFNASVFCSNNAERDR